MASAKEIPPGGEGKIDVTFKVGSSAGKKSKTITVTTNDPENKTVKLKISADIKVILSASPSRLYLGRFIKGEAPVKYIALAGQDNASTNIIKVETSGKNKFLKVNIVTDKEGDNQNEKIAVTVLPDSFYI